MLSMLLGWNTSSAAAQASPSAGRPGNVVARLVKAGSDDYKDASGLTPINRAACEAGTLTVLLGSLPDADTYPDLEVWLATGIGECEQADRDARASTSGTTLNCTKLEVKNSYRFSTIAALEFELGPACEGEGAWTLYFLALRGGQAGEAANFYATLPFSIDKTAPDAPTDVQAGTGSSNIPLTWAPAPHAAGYVILFDEDAKQSDDGSCESELLQEGASVSVKDFPAGMSIQSNGNSMSSAQVDGLALLGGAGTLGAAVVAVDRAGNMSPLSQVVCLSVVDPNDSQPDPDRCEH